MVAVSEYKRRSGLDDPKAACHLARGRAMESRLIKACAMTWSETICGSP
jgi:hypothetical protein